jgi:hypothetical protein
MKGLFMDIAFLLTIVILSIGILIVVLKCSLLNVGCNGWMLDIIICLVKTDIQTKKRLISIDIKKYFNYH